MKQELQEMLDGCENELNDIEKKIQKTPALDKMRSYLTNYALIKACGTTEFVYRSILADYFDKFQDSRIEKYIENTVRKGSYSSTYENMMKLLAKFDSNWQKTFKTKVNQDPNKDRMIQSALSLVNNRHSFAHGRSPSATFSDIKQYYADVVNIIKIFDSVVF